MFEFANHLVNIFANDPNARGLGLEQVPLPSGPSPFHISGWTGNGGLYDAGTVEFQAGHLYVVLNRTHDVWCDFIGTTVPWRSGTAQIPVEPRAGKDFNAYYDRQGLYFFYNTDAVTRQPVYACESSDVVAHECGHAILDAHHPDYWDSLLAETAAFHEAFGDISALLVTLQEEQVRQAVLTETNGDLSKSNVATRLAEQMARGIMLGGHPEAVVSLEAMRDLANRFRYADADKLPARAPASKLSSESHSLSRVFSGAFYDLLVGIYSQLRKANPLLSPDAALAKACADAGRLIGQALVLAPKGDASFKTIAASMFTADAQNYAGAYFNTLRQTFVSRRVLKAKEADALKSTNGSGYVQTSTLGGTAAAKLGRIESLGFAAAMPGEEVPTDIRDLLKLSGDCFCLAGKQIRRGVGGVLHYTMARTLELTGPDLGVARGAHIMLTDAVAVHLDRDGRMISSFHHCPDERQEHRIRSHVLRLIERGRVYAAAPGELVDTTLLLERKQPYYIAYDEAGNKRIRRAFIACGSDGM